MSLTLLPRDVVVEIAREINQAVAFWAFAQTCTLAADACRLVAPVKKDQFLHVVMAGDCIYHALPNGTRHGRLSLLFHTLFTPSLILNYMEGILHGPQIVLHENGHYSMYANWENGKLHGMRYQYKEDGSLWRSGNFVQGFAEGEWREWKGTQLVKKWNMFRGDKNGAEVTFDAAGKRMTVTTYRDGKQHGHHCAYYSNGQLEEVGQYREGEKASTWFFWQLGNPTPEFIRLGCLSQNKSTHSTYDLDEEECYAYIPE